MFSVLTLQRLVSVFSTNTSEAGIFVMRSLCQNNCDVLCQNNHGILCQNNCDVLCQNNHGILCQNNHDMSRGWKISQWLRCL